VDAGAQHVIVMSSDPFAFDRVEALVQATR